MHTNGMPSEEIRQVRRPNLSHYVHDNLTEPVHFTKEDLQFLAPEGSCWRRGSCLERNTTILVIQDYWRRGSWEKEPAPSRII